MINDVLPFPEHPRIVARRFKSRAKLDNPRVMSAMGHKRTFSEVYVMSALPPKADIAEDKRHVR